MQTWKQAIFAFRRGSLSRWQIASEKRLPFPSASPVCGH